MGSIMEADLQQWTLTNTGKLDSETEKATEYYFKGVIFIFKLYH